jgi:sugar phosphate isomerase/epimerase
MRLACICGSFNRTFESGALNQLGFLARCRHELAVDGVELQDIHFPQTRPAYLQMLRRMARDLGLPIVAIGVHNDFGRIDPTIRQSEVTKVKQWVEVAEQLGAPLVRVFAGYPEGERTPRWDPMIEALREVTAFARDAGVRLGLENHNHGAFTPTAEPYLRILREVASPYLVPLVDTGNFTDGWESLQRVLPAAVHVHAKFWDVQDDGSDRRVDYPRIMAALRAAAYDGWMTFEYEAPEPETSGLSRALRFLRTAMPGAS